MAGFRRSQMSLFLMLLLQLPAAVVAARDLLLSSYVRVGDEVTLSRENVLHDQNNCDGTTWLYSPSGNTSIELIKLGQISKNGKDKADRLNVTANCSLVIKKVTVEDVGIYVCQQYKAGKHQRPDSRVYLSLVNVAGHESAGVVTLRCSVTTNGRCGQIKWLFLGNDVDSNHPNLKTTQSSCSASVTFHTSDYIYPFRYKNTFKCDVTDVYTGRKHLFPLRLQPAGEKPGETTVRDAATTTSSTEAGNITTTEASAGPHAAGVWRLLVVSTGLAALIIAVVGVNVWTRAKGKKTQTDENKEPNEEDDAAVNYENVTSSSAV